ncbi:MAG: pseudaminic acid cytidylyltransferase [Sulfuritalea sp.]|nr:pseudaminic acid cytidylyltransferase [Sulfuritalea sp.]
MRLAVIPARGGSKRIPRKNIKDFCGKPMIAYSIECAIGSGLFNEVVVSTDDEEIAAVARSCGARIPFMRPAELANDHAGTIPVIAHATEWFKAAGHSPSAVCCIYATAPFVQPGDLKQGLEILESGPWEYVFSATSFGFPIFRSFKRLADGSVEMFYPEYFETRSQDLPEAFHDAGQFYWGRPGAWTGNKRFFDHWSNVVMLPRWRVQDIDSAEDWERAEVLMKLLREQGGSPR